MNSEVIDDSTARWRRWRVWLSGLAIALLGLPCLQDTVADPQLRVENPYRVEAAFLRNFARYVTWPDHAFPMNGSSWCIGVLGQDPFGDILEVTLEGRTEQGRSFEIFRVNTLNELPLCQIVFIAYESAEKRRAALFELKDKPVLTVGNAPDFLYEGGIILLEARERVRMSINLDQARAASLSIQTKMLEVSYNVMENGVLRKVR